MLRCAGLVASVLCFFVVAENVGAFDNVPPPNDFEFKFTEQLYNVSIPENSVAKTYATQSPGSTRMGIQVVPNTFTDIR
ncbi:hypothetical protein GWI33_003288 [Rhynchophorus ferrugineus]|uniref:Uncharacterized protein n=1 Tax=Rhynchophorus ferrugineus TaxID=354439 RepID=A0A834IJI5_RHYFE|nr:hypothetical protein GWI33_003288 [Rhynchophorus ferrugineus]